MTAISPCPARLLVIEDDAVLCTHLQDFLTSRQHQVTVCRDGRAGLQQALDQPFDLVLLDILLPGMNGLDLLAELRQRSGVPVIVLSALGDEQDRISGLMKGADDYLPKPFSSAELAVRVEAVLRRVTLERRQSQGVAPVGALVLRTEDETAWYREADLGLTTTEFRLLRVFLEHRDQVLSKAFLYQAVLHRGYGRHDRSLDLHVSHLRRKLRDVGMAEQPLRTVWGQGYTLVSEAL
ncbi:DNA-binding response regulator [Alcanivorax sp. KX64203]|nr:DNA-binding response regulator [Alcanivorax sp. KX64203]